MIKPLVQLLRPKQWTKNLICFAGVIFGGHLAQPELLLRGLGAFAAFCAASSAVYVLNDLADAPRDRLHPRKRLRPVASGAISPALAGVIGLGLAAATLVGSFVLNVTTFLCIAAYLLVNVAYSLRLKHHPIIDVTCIALGFSFRMLGGVFALPEKPTPWITLCTFFLALFIGFGKRRAELAELATAGNDTSTERRPVLAAYTIPLLDSLLLSSSTIALMSYALFTVSSGRNPSLVITVPTAAFVVMHFSRRISQGTVASAPDELLLHDRPIQVGILLWLVTYVIVLYGRVNLFH